MLATPGGDLHAAYRVARCLQGRYEKLTVHVPGMCAGAGTLIAVAAHELVVSDHGALGPLAVYTAAPDEPPPGVTAADALTHLTSIAVRSFAETLLAIRRACGADITLRTATEMAARLTVGLLAPLSSRLDPMRIAETAAARATAACYGQRLLEHAGNIDRESFERLTCGYPSPDFVIDREEARRLFRKVRGPTPNEARLTETLGVRAAAPADWPASGGGHAAFSSSERPDTAHAGPDAGTGDDEDAGF